MRGHTARGHTRRTEILATYRDVLIEEGPANASIGKLSKQLGLPSSAIMYYFETKGELTAELVDCLLDEYDTVYGAKLAAIDDPLERLRALVDAYLTPAFQAIFDNHAYYSCLALSLYDERVRRRFEALFASSLQRTEETIRECMQRGLIPEGDATQLARAVYALEEGFSVLTAWDPTSVLSQELSLHLRRAAISMLGLPPDDRIEA